MKQFMKRAFSGVVAFSLIVSQIPILPVFATENSELEAIKAQLPYTGDISKMNLSPEQALAMADQIEAVEQSHNSPSVVALFDGGDGAVSFITTPYTPKYSKIDMYMYPDISDTMTSTGNGYYEHEGALVIAAEVQYVYYWNESAKSMEMTNLTGYKAYEYPLGQRLGICNRYITVEDGMTILGEELKNGFTGGDGDGSVLNRIEFDYNQGNQGQMLPVHHYVLDTVAESLWCMNGETLEERIKMLVEEEVAEHGLSYVFNPADVILYGDDAAFLQIIDDKATGEMVSHVFGAENALSDYSHVEEDNLPDLYAVGALYVKTCILYGDWELGEDTASLLRQYAELAQFRFKFPEFSLDSNITDLFSSLNLTGTMLECYEVAGNFYYVIMEENGVETGYLICAVKENGEIVYKIVHESTEILPEDTLSVEGNSYTFDSNIQIEFEEVKDFESQEEYVSYFRNSLQNITGTSLNDQGKSELALSMQDSIVNFATHVLHLSSGTGEIKEEEVTPMVEKSNGLYQDFVTLLREEQAELNKDLEQTVRVVLQGLDEENWTVYLNPDLIGQLQGNNLQVFLASGQQGLEVTAEDLESLLNTHDGLFINVQNTGNDQYAISFADNEGNSIEKLENPVKIFLPTTNEFATVMLDYAQGSENWGGQFNASTNTIQFSTIHSGTYVIVDNSVEIHDVNENYLSMIQFMVSKGFFEVDENGNFNPEGTMDRNQFTKTIVSMFFALDHDLKSNFPDVSPDSPYYSYIASGESRDIVAGYDDGFFHGDEILTEEMAFALIAQTLVDKKGYSYPEELDFYLNSVEGGNSANDWAKRNIALSVRDSIIATDETIHPTGNISRQNAAVYLYRLFMLLEGKQQIYFELVEETTLEEGEEPDSNSEKTETEESTAENNNIIYGVVGVGIGMVVAFLAMKGKKKE